MARILARGGSRALACSGKRQTPGAAGGLRALDGRRGRATRRLTPARAAMAGLALAVIAFSAPPSASAVDNPAPVGPASPEEHRRQCAGRTGWADPAPPIRIFANVFDVGTCGIVVLLITGPAGHVMIDAATAEAVPAIVANLRRLGIAPASVRRLLTSHPHSDHVGGLHALQRTTGATVVATSAAAARLAQGTPAADDPQRPIMMPFRGVRVGQTLRDGESVVLGQLRLTAHATPGHAPGGTSWTWRSCAGAVCRRMVFADSISAVAADRYRFADHPAQVRRLRASMATVATLPCDLIITPHPEASRLYERLYGMAPLADPAGCSRYAAAGRARLDARLAAEARGNTD